MVIPRMIDGFRPHQQSFSEAHERAMTQRQIV